MSLGQTDAALPRVNGAHAKHVSVGNAASLFGGAEGSDDFFSGSSVASKAPAGIEQIQELDEDAEVAPTPSPFKEAPPDLFGASTTSSDWLAASDHGQSATTYEQPSSDAYSQINGHEQDYSNAQWAKEAEPLQQPYPTSYDDYNQSVATRDTGQASHYAAEPYTGSSTTDDTQYAYYPQQQLTVTPGNAYDPYGPASQAVSPYSAPPAAANYQHYPATPPVQPFSADAYSGFAQPTASPPMINVTKIAPSYPRTGAYSPPPMKKRSVTSPANHRKTSALIGSLGSTLGAAAEPELPSMVALPPRLQSASPGQSLGEGDPRRAASAIYQHSPVQQEWQYEEGMAHRGPDLADDAYNHYAQPYDDQATRASVYAGQAYVATSHATPPPPIQQQYGPIASTTSYASPPAQSSSPAPQIDILPPSPNYDLGTQAQTGLDWSNQGSSQVSDVLADLEDDVPIAYDEGARQMPQTDEQASIPNQSQSRPDPYASGTDPGTVNGYYGDMQAYNNYGEDWAAQNAVAEPQVNGDRGGRITYSEYRRRTHGSTSTKRSDEDSAGGSGYGGNGRMRTGSMSTSASRSPVLSQDFTPLARSLAGNPYDELYGQSQHTSQYAVGTLSDGVPMDRPFTMDEDVASQYRPNVYEREEQPLHSTLHDPYGAIDAAYEAESNAYEPAGPYEQGMLSAYAANKDFEPPRLYEPSPYSTAEHDQAYDTVGRQSRFEAAPEDNGYGPTAYGTIDRSYTASPAGAVGHGSTGPDPLERDKRIVPLVSFGFGGKMILCFPACNFSTLSANTPRISIRKAQEASEADETFPGPLFHDVGWNKALQQKKRKEVVTWLEQRIIERERELSFISAASAAIPETEGTTQSGEGKQRVQDRAVMLKLLRILVENDGKLAGSTQIDDAIRGVLIEEGQENATLPTAADIHQDAASMAHGAGAIISVTEMRESDLDSIQKLLLRGDRKAAMRQALDRRLWGHALVIASAAGPEAWQEAVSELLRTELSAPTEAGTESNGRESLRVIYGLFAGLSGTAIYDFAPAEVADQLRNHVPPQPAGPNGAAGGNSTAVASGARSLTPGPNPPTTRSPTPASMSFAAPLPLSAATLNRWRETAAMIVANRVAGDTSALLVLGETLLANQRVDAAHCCFLLSSPSGTLGGLRQSGAVMSLLGVDLLDNSATLDLDSDVIALTEIVEFALSLVPTVKGQDAFNGLPHLQAFRLAQAVRLADLGLTARAQRYVEAVGATLKLAVKLSPYYSPVLIEQIRTFSERLVGVPSDKSGSWIKGLQRPKLDTLWSTLEDRVSKFVAGEGENRHKSGGPDIAASNAAVKGIVGPFSHYSSISPASTNGQVSRVSSHQDLQATAASASAPVYPMAPPPRPSSASSKRAPAATRGKSNSSGPTRHSHKKSMSLGYLAYGSDPYAGNMAQASDAGNDGEDSFRRPHSFDQPSRSNLASLDEDESSQSRGTPQHDGGWWSAAGRAEVDDDGQNLVPPTFANISEEIGGDGFVSPMAASGFSPALAQPDLGRSYMSAPAEDLDDVEDLGFGNARPKLRLSESTGSAPPASKTPATTEDDPTRPVIKQTSSSWSLGRWFRRDMTSPAPGAIKANMGEESSFYYDPELKRWVNKKAGGTSDATPEPIPPPRAQSAAPIPSAAMAAALEPSLPAIPRSAKSFSGGVPARQSAPTPPLPPASAPPAQRKASAAPVKGKGGRRYVDVM